jgi:protocatechuate 3,4-dioxygenase beta subunit
MRVKHIHFKLFAQSGQSLTTEIELLPDEYAASDELYNPNLAATLQKKENSNTGIPEYSVHFDFLLSLASPSKSGV